MKTYCLNCKTKTETDLVAEVRACRLCGRNFDDYGMPEITALRAENERLRGALRRLYEPAKIASVQIVCMCGEDVCQPCENREKLAEALHEVKAILEGQDDRAPE